MKKLDKSSSKKRRKERRRKLLKPPLRKMDPKTLRNNLIKTKLKMNRLMFLNLFTQRVSLRLMVKKQTSMRARLIKLTP